MDCRCQDHPGICKILHGTMSRSIRRSVRSLFRIFLDLNLQAFYRCLVCQLLQTYLFSFIINLCFDSGKNYERGDYFFGLVSRI